MSLVSEVSWQVGKERFDVCFTRRCADHRIVVPLRLEVAFQQFE